MAVRVITGYENATLRDVMRTWVYSKNIVEVLRAAVELRKRYLDFNALKDKPEDRVQYGTGPGYER